MKCWPSWAWLLAPILGLGCSEDPPVEPELPVAHGLVGCPDGRGCVTYRGVGGISMGGGSAMRIVLESPELFDLAASLGSPYIDLEYFLFSVSEVSNGGFCPPERLLPDQLPNLDVADHPATWCGPIQYSELALPNSRCDGFAGDYNHYYRGPSAGRGGSFNRVGSLEIVQDFALAYGNPAFYNDQDPYLPPGVPREQRVGLELTGEAKAQRRRTICSAPTILEGRHDRIYNPRGEFPVITYCDGDGPENGVYQPGQATFPVEVALAVDYNRNGRRDWAEPVIAQATETLFDTGVDGVADVDEPGYDPDLNPDPAGDNYHWLDNPRGSEGNLRHEDGEPLDDAGLDGVPETGDYGEGNGRFDLNPNVEYTFTRSPRRLIEALRPGQLERLHFWADAGIRDFLLSAQITNQFWGALLAREPDARLYTDWSELATVAHGGGRYDASRADLSARAIGRHAYLRYGDPAVCPGVDAVSGRGNHVGSAQEALDRIATALAFASARFEDGDRRAYSGGILDQGGPTGELSDFVKESTFDSAALGRAQPYVVILPPDYYLNPEARYPVFYFLHGQGQKASDLAAVALLALSPQMSSTDPERARAGKSDWQKMIVVFADGECQPGECHTGSFYLDHGGKDGGGVRHGEAFFELMRLVESQYRTKTPRRSSEGG